jgi:mono/diheme cytochrome c family protein
VLEQLCQADDFRWRAYGARLAGAWAAGLPAAREWLHRGAADPEMRVRLEALVAAVDGVPAEAAFPLFRRVLAAPRDRFLDYALTNAARALRPHWQAAEVAGPASSGLDDGERAFLEEAAGKARPEKPAGQRIYENLCLSCHQPGGEGLGDLYPPIAGSPWVSGDPGVLIRMLLHGVQGPMEVRGKVFDNVMPPSGLSDAQIAEVLTYVRNSFGNSSGPVSPAQVEALRAAYADRAMPWTAEELR